MSESRRPNARVGRQINETTKVEAQGGAGSAAGSGPGERRISFGGVLFSVGASLVVLVGVGVGMNFWMNSVPSNDADTTASNTDGPRATVQDPVVTALPFVATALSSGQEEEVAEDDVPTMVASNEITPVDSSGDSEVIKLETSEVVVSYGAAESLYLEGEYGEAAGAFAAYAKGHPQNQWGHYMEALSLWKSGRAASAEQAFLRALDCNPDHIKSLVNLTRVRIELEQFAEARLPIERALRLAPESIQVHRVFGRVEHNLGQVDAAESRYLQALRIDAGDVWSLNNLGLLRIELGRYEEALAPLALACLLDSANATAQNNLGSALERSGDLRAAELAYLCATTADPDHSRAGASRERVAARIDQQSRPPVDLAALAYRFVEELAASDTAMTDVDEDLVPAVANVAQVAAVAAVADGADGADIADVADVAEIRVPLESSNELVVVPVVAIR